MPEKTDGFDPIATPSSAGHVLVAGSLAFDQIMDYGGFFKDHILPDKLHMINLSFLVKELRKQRGGCAGNISYSLSLLGERPRVLAAAGFDFGEYGAFLGECGVDASEILIDPEQVTACCFITTDRANNQITGFFPGAMGRARELSVAASAAAARPEYTIVAPDDPEAMVRHCREAKEAGIRLVFDPSFQVIAFDGDTLREAARGAFAVLLNDYEFAIFQEKTGIVGPALFDYASMWVVTLGERGSRILLPDGEIEIPAAKPREVVDPTGAGDAYRSGFVAGLLRGLPLPVCGRMGSVAAVYVIEAYGPQGHRYTREEFAARYHESFGDLT